MVNSNFFISSLWGLLSRSNYYMNLLLKPLQWAAFLFNVHLFRLHFTTDYCTLLPIKKGAETDESHYQLN